MTTLTAAKHESPNTDMAKANKSVSLNIEEIPERQPDIAKIDFNSDTIRHLTRNLSHLLTWRSAGSYSAAELYQDTISLMKHLPYDQRKAIYCYYVLDWTLQMTAEEMHISHESVRNLCNRGIAAMAAEIEAYE